MGDRSERDNGHDEQEWNETSIQTCIEMNRHAALLGNTLRKRILRFPSPKCTVRKCAGARLAGPLSTGCAGSRAIAPIRQDSGGLLRLLFDQSGGFLTHNLKLRAVHAFFRRLREKLGLTFVLRVIG